MVLFNIVCVVHIVIHLRAKNGYYIFKLLFFVFSGTSLFDSGYQIIKGDDRTEVMPSENGTSTILSKYIGGYY